MFEGIVDSIICSEFEHKFGRSRENVKSTVTTLVGRKVEVDTCSDPYNAMQVKFSLNPDFSIEDGYRNLTLLIFGGGMNYYAVYGKIDWNVIPYDEDLAVEGMDEDGYVKGDTGWVLLAYHDSCWREGVHDILWNNRERISHIDSLFNGNTGWYKRVPIDDAFAEQLHQIRKSTPGYGGSGTRLRLSELEFKFPQETEHAG